MLYNILNQNKNRKFSHKFNDFMAVSKPEI